MGRFFVLRSFLADFPIHSRKQSGSEIESRSSKPMIFRQRHSILIVPYAAIVFCLSCLVACSHHHDPQTDYDRAVATFQRGDLLGAQQRAQKGYEEFRSKGPEWAWKFVLLVARVQYERGMSDDALKLIASQHDPVPPGELEVRKCRVEGLAFTALHRFHEAEESLDHADRVCAKNNYPVCSDVVSAKGSLEMARGDYPKAEKYFENVLTSARSSRDEEWEADTLLNLSWAADEQGHFDEAIDRASAARTIALAKGIADVSQKSLGNMGWAYYKLGDTEKAEIMFLEAKKQAEKVGSTGDQALWLQAAGYTYLDMQKYDVAEESYHQSLDLAEKTKNREQIVNSLIALAFVSEQTGKLDDASRYADEALSMAKADGNKRDQTYPRLVQGRIAAQQHDPVAAQNALFEVIDSNDSPVFLKWEAQRSLAHLYEDENQNEGAAREYRAALSTFEAARSELQHENSRLPFLTNATRIYDDYIHLLVKQGKTADALQVADYSRARTLSEGLGLLKSTSSFKPDPLNAQNVARKVRGGVFFYWLGEKQSYLWLVTPQKTELFSLPPRSEIDDAVKRYRKALIGPQDPLESMNADGLALYRMLIEPVRESLPKNAKVFVIPDVSLNTLNFETLLVPGPTPHYWIEDVTIENASSLRMLASSRTPESSNRSLLLLGNAVAPNSDYPELRKASDEIGSIEKYFSSNQQKVFAREQATPAAYLTSNPTQFRYIHFVAHGTASRMSPLDSAIVLSRAGAQDDSFKLYARDIIQHPLRANLVTISTCYGAGDRAYSGEGLVGLSWAFLRAGAHNVIGALWEVSDVSTPQLMDKLYGAMEKGQPPDAALRAAKLSLLHSGNAFRKPFYWAPFQLYTGS